jgi:hypothetical protein
MRWSVFETREKMNNGDMDVGLWGQDEKAEGAQGMET